MEAAQAGAVERKQITPSKEKKEHALATRSGSKRRQEAARRKPGNSLMEPAETLRDYHRLMVRIRVFEGLSMRAFRSGLAGGYLHVYNGMEGTAVGWLSCVREGDPIIAAYRDHGYALILGMDPVDVMAEIMGRARGVSRGKGGSMHLYSAEHSFYGGWAIVGGHTAMGVGLAFATKYRGGDEVTHLFFGDGAANAGVLYESMNMASLWDLPVVFILENNEIAMGTRLEYHAADTHMHNRAEGFNIEHERIDGMNVLHVRKDALRIIDHVRKTQRPYFVEIMSFRFEGHGAADHDRSLYRSKEEEKEAGKRDPILLLEQYMLETGVMIEGDIKVVWKDVEQEMERAYKEAADMPKPEPHEVYENVYTDILPEEGH
ncbi:MAG: pyruvate dehydrogenase (acetyl-transferring) E1 component subunit alpha [Armatimonadetes bacterium]|nr:pyruvate dehydrogenase (acetyl-transferring) E1 component subunit alpha [Armatimonadota bacterium]